jgi:hypothetical protein
MAQSEKQLSPSHHWQENEQIIQLWTHSESTEVFAPSTLATQFLRKELFKKCLLLGLSSLWYKFFGLTLWCTVGTVCPRPWPPWTGCSSWWPPPCRSELSGSETDLVGLKISVLDTIRMDPHWFWSAGSGSGIRIFTVLWERLEDGRRLNVFKIYRAYVFLI